MELETNMLMMEGIFGFFQNSTVVVGGQILWKMEMTAFWQLGYSLSLKFDRICFNYCKSILL